jgi:hypothetical protein
MPVAVSPTKVRSTDVTDIRYWEDAADLDKPEDLPVSIIFAAFGNKSLGIKEKQASCFLFSFCPFAAVLS